ncbi:putative Malectin domain-containing protein [Helianthus anomalus]
MVEYDIMHPLNALYPTRSLVNSESFKLSPPLQHIYIEYEIIHKCANDRCLSYRLIYYGLCLLNVNYNLTLYFAEIVLSQDKSYNSLGKRVFDVYVQGELKIKDFDIVKEAGGTGRAVLKKYMVNVNKNTSKIQLYWAGKGTTCIPKRGSYGPIISAISVEPSKKFFVYHTRVSYL